MLVPVHLTRTLNREYVFEWKIKGTVVSFMFDAIVRGIPNFKKT